MEVTFLGHAGTNGCRTLYFFPHLAREGIQARYVEAKSGDRARTILGLPPCDALVVQRLSLAPSELVAARARAKRLVYDVDDPVMYRSSRHLLRFSPARRAGFRRMAAAADALVGSSPLIAAEALKVLAPGRVFVVPSTVDADIYRPREKGEGKGVVLGWLGSAGTVKYLERLRGTLAEVSRRVPGARLKVVSNRFPVMDGIPMDRKAWRRDEEVGDLQSFDVGLLPLSDDLWTRGKGHGKLFQYLAVGSPVAGSPVGIVAEAVREGVTGFLPRTKSAWVEKLVLLCRDAAMRQRMGAAARRDFEERFSVQAVLPTLVKAIRGG